MPIQVFVDESIGYGRPRHFGMAGLVAPAEKWLKFSEEWKATLEAEPRVHLFKMQEAALRTGAFNKARISEARRDQKLIALAQAINRHVDYAMYTLVDLDAHAKTWKGGLKKPLNDPYFWPFYLQIWSAAMHAEVAGVAERIKLIFDESVISGLRADSWYPICRLMMEQKAPELAALMPASIIFETDDKWAPLQAADFIVGCVRRSVDDGKFQWLIDEHMPNLNWSGHSGIISQAMMEGMLDRKGKVSPQWADPDAIRAVYRRVFGR